MTLGSFSSNGKPEWEMGKYPWEGKYGGTSIGPNNGLYRTEHTNPSYVPPLADPDYKNKAEYILSTNEPHWDNETISVECENCGKWFDKQKSVVRESENHNHFHNRECYHEYNRGENHYNYKGGADDYYGKTWNENRRKTYERDDKKCQDCGMNTEDHIRKYGCSPHVHHIIPHRLFRENEKANKMKNLLTLCNSCHNKHEQWADYVAEKRGFK